MLLNLWKESGVPLMERMCGSDKQNFKPNPAIDVRNEAVLNATERLQTPYTWCAPDWQRRVAPSPGGGGVKASHRGCRYTDEGCRQQAWEYYKAVVTRTNSITGTSYADDPTIFRRGRKGLAPAARSPTPGWSRSLPAHPCPSPCHPVGTC